MKSTIKKTLFVLFLIIGTGILVSIGIVVYEVYTARGSCGMYDGPYHAGLIEPVAQTEMTKKIHLGNHELLILDNRNDSLSPVLSLVDKGQLKWNLDMDTRYTNPSSPARIWRLEELSAKGSSKRIKLNFIAHWTFGREKGWMEIELENGENYFCLGW